MRGKGISYAAVPLERIDWRPFDIMGVDLYRSAEVADQFAAGVGTLVAQGKSVAITEFGTANRSSPAATWPIRAFPVPMKEK